MINIVERLDEQTAKKIRQFPHPNNRASEAGHPCVRFLVLSRLQPELKTLHDVGLQRIFDEGNLHEKAVLREMEDAGFKIVEQQRPFSWTKFHLSGHIDAKIETNATTKPLLTPLEIKSCSPNAFRHIKDLEPMEMVKSRLSWVRKYPAQILCYMLMDGKEEGIIIFKNKTTGEKCQKNFNLKLDSEYEYTESILKKLEKVNEYVDKNELPLVEMCEDCRDCGFQKTSCFPGHDYGPGFAFLSDAELEKRLKEREKLKPLFRKYNELDKLLKGHFKAIGKNAIVGDSFKVEIKHHSNRTEVVIERLP